QPTSKSELDAIFDMVRSHVQQSAPKEWWCFFRLGMTVAWLTQRLEARQSLTAVRRDLEVIRDDDRKNRALSFDTRYLRAVDQLLSILPTVLTLSETDRVDVVRRVNMVLESLPKGEASFRVAPFPLPITDWYWVQVEGMEGVAMRFIGRGHLTAYPGGKYEL